MIFVLNDFCMSFKQRELVGGVMLAVWVVLRECLKGNRVMMDFVCSAVAAPAVGAELEPIALGGCPAVVIVTNV